MERVSLRPCPLPTPPSSIPSTERVTIDRWGLLIWQVARSRSTRGWHIKDGIENGDNVLALGAPGRGRVTVNMDNFAIREEVCGPADESVPFCGHLLYDEQRLGPLVEVEYVEIHHPVFYFVGTLCFALRVVTGRICLGTS